MAAASMWPPCTVLVSRVSAHRGKKSLGPSAKEPTMASTHKTYRLGCLGVTRDMSSSASTVSRR
eukprot:10582412-Karenia_brevis.AAC.1